MFQDVILTEHGSYLLLRGLSPSYHQRNLVSHACSGWERVGPKCYCYQRVTNITSWLHYQLQ
jgi:hypothetical protein